ncbi:MAG: shikimate kinase [Sporichthyaceae bacterium]
MNPARVLLVGMMGAGKTSVGRALAARTGWGYRDNDEIVAEIEGVPTDELLKRGGRDALRAAESHALSRVLETDPPLIAGVAGGVIESAADRTRLASPDAFVVYLHAPIEVLVDRVGSGEGRPWLQPDPEKAMRRLFEGREPLYREVADLVLDRQDGDAEQHADQILGALERWSPGH